MAGLLASGYTGTALALILSDENIVRLNQVTIHTFRSRGTA